MKEKVSKRNGSRHEREEEETTQDVGGKDNIKAS